MGYKNVVFPAGTSFLVTGGAGFIGSNLCEALLKAGCRVRCLDDLSTGKQANVDLLADWPGYTFIQPIGRANYILRCMNVPAGKHTIHMQFRPKTVEQTETIANISFYVIIIILILALLFGRRRKTE